MVSVVTMRRTLAREIKALDERRSLCAAMLDAIDRHPITTCKPTNGVHVKPTNGTQVGTIADRVRGVLRVRWATADDVASTLGLDRQLVHSTICQLPERVRVRPGCGPVARKEYTLMR